MDEPPLKFTIATVTYNAGALLGRTIASVEEQDYPHVEHLIIDGNSQDETLALGRRAPRSGLPERTRPRAL